jgi:ATP-dependent DNA helicase RecQ
VSEITGQWKPKQGPMNRASKSDKTQSKKSSDQSSGGSEDATTPSKGQGPESNGSSGSNSLATTGDLECSPQQLSQWRELLQDRFGLDEFRPGQLPVIQRLMSGRSAAAIFPTGGGKSLCYQLPAALFDGLTLVVSPLLALMREQVDQLNRLGIAAYRMDSSLSAQQSSEAYKALKAGTAKLLYVAPERFFNERFRESIEGLNISLFAVDEAHCISQWGHNFRPDYLKLARIAKQLKAQRILALTATATPSVLQDICQQFEIAPEDAIQTPFFRPNLRLSVKLCDNKSRQQTLVERLSPPESRPSIVYVTLQKTAVEVAQQLEKQGLPARPYHAGLEDVERRAVQDWFMESSSAIVVATIAFGMGIDKSNIRSVIHFNPSKSLESYAQEIGRAGRDGQQSFCETLLVPEDRVTLENFAYGDSPSRDGIKQFVETIARQPQEFFVSYYSLAYETDMRDGVIRTLLTNLELQEIIESTVPRYDQYKFKPKVNSSSILKNFEGERRQFASNVLTMAVKKKVYFEIDVAHASVRLKEDRARIVRMLEYFDQNQWIELEASGLVFGYRKLQPIKDAVGLVEKLETYLKEREQGEIGRIDQMYQLLASRHCQSVELSRHFGQALQDACRKCAVCTGLGLKNIPTASYPQVGDSAKSAVMRLRKLHPELLKDARQQARFLCGLSSPKFIRARLSRDSSFGCCSEIPFDQVVRFLQA